MVIEFIWKAGWCISWKYCKAGLGVGKEMPLHDDDANSTHRWNLYFGEWNTQRTQSLMKSEIPWLQSKRFKKEFGPSDHFAVPCNSWDIPTISVQLPNHHRLRIQCPNRKHHVKLCSCVPRIDFWLLTSFQIRRPSSIDVFRSARSFREQNNQNIWSHPTKGSFRTCHPHII